MPAYYNEVDPFAAAWLRELIKAGCIAPGEVDERSIEDVRPDDLRGFSQCHFFAGIGVWSWALRCAGWPDDRPVWTGSCPCQPFSAAGKGGGFADERHLWPAFFHLVGQCRPNIVFGEQVASKDGLAWLDLVQADLEGAGYACGAVDTCAAGFGAPHIRQRLYWVADSQGGGIGAGLRNPEPGGERRAFAPDGGDALRLADAAGQGPQGGGPGGTSRPGHEGAAAERGGAPDGLADAAGARHVGPLGGAEGEARDEARLRLLGAERGPGGLAESDGRPDSGISARECEQRFHPEGGNDLRFEGSPEWQEERNLRMPRPTDGHWRDADWLRCRDGVWRPVIPSFIALVNGLAIDMVHSRDYSNGKGKTEKEEVANASCTQGNTKKELPILPQENGAETNQRQTGGFTGFHAEEVLRQEVHGKVDGEGEVRTEALQGQVPPTSDAGMRNMWQDYFAACPPQERPAVRQHTVELDDIMRELPQASSLAKLHGDRNTEEALYLLHKRLIQESNVQHTLEQTAQVWASLGEEEKDRFGVGLDVRAWRRLEFFPLEVGAPARVGRLRGYGNAIVAPQAAAFVKAYMETLENRCV